MTRFPLRIPLASAVAWQVVLGSGFRGMLTGLAEPAVDHLRAAFGRLLRERGMTDLDATSLIGVGTRP
ncbi:hypothetical protein ABZW11_12665 [Nonomuraea sp. NPDC004580]|uniref:hypothetical protein n=1 Tax=Nonomuraea sp. NPDC004580 TaxID=3154552 RepID=UPI0033B66BEF